jgi:hypothetical protein
LCWTGTDRPSVLFERATAWLVTHKVLLPGCSTLEHYIACLRSRVEERLWRLLAQGIDSEQQTRLERLLAVPPGSRSSQLDRLRTGPVTISGPSLVQALLRLRSVRELGIKLPATARIPETRVAALARFAGAAKASVDLRLPWPRRLAALVAFVHCLEATAQDDALEVLEALLRELYGDAVIGIYSRNSVVHACLHLNRSRLPARAASRGCRFPTPRTARQRVPHSHRRSHPKQQTDRACFRAATRGA